MFDEKRLRRDHAEFASDAWLSSLVALARRKLGDGAHGNLAAWRELLDSLPKLQKVPITISDGVVCLDLNWPELSSDMAREKLMRLVPWRKGPFRIGDIDIDSEWRSDLKWARIEGEISPLQNRRVLDVGCGNGYYALRMRDQGAQLVLGVDPTVLFVVQFLALMTFARNVPVHVLPLRLHELPAGAPHFDTTFSMGVLYHQRDPRAHLTQLKASLRAGGELVLETLIMSGSDSTVIVPDDRYARMRNVWHLPSQARLVEWLADSGFDDIRVVDETRTTTHEQRSTDWMPFESLREALDPADPARTIEGLPAPLRIVAICRNPS